MSSLDACALLTPPWVWQGLGEIYEEEYVRAAAGGAAADDRDEKVRAEARGLVKLLFAKLDALSHFHFAPKPVIEDLSVRADVPALAMEEVAPQVRASFQTSLMRICAWQVCQKGAVLSCPAVLVS